jgi:hypothetical protein
MITTHPLNGPRVVSPQEAPGHLALQPQAGPANMVQMVVNMMMQTMQRQDHMMGMMIENTIRSNGPAGPPSPLRRGGCEGGAGTCQMITRVSSFQAMGGIW